MKTFSEQFLTASEQQQITDTVKQTERLTSGEIVPMVISQCNRYPIACLKAAVLLAFPIAYLLTYIIGNYFWQEPENLWLFIGSFALSMWALFIGISKNRKVIRFLIDKETAEHEVKEAAFAAFYTHALYKTRNENGVLLFISVLEQKVWILAGTNIAKKVDNQAWENIIGTLTLGIKQGQQANAISHAIEQIGEILQAHFPYQSKDENELHNLIIIK